MKRLAFALLLLTALVVPAQDVRRRPIVADTTSTLNNNVVAFWKLEEASGTRDDAVSTNDLTDNATVTQAAGKVGNAAQFTSANSEYLDIADNAALSITSNVSIAAWVYLDSSMASTAPAIVGKWNEGTNQRSYILLYNGFDSRFQFSVSSDGTGANQFNVQATTFGAPSTATWYFVFAYFDDTANQIGISVNNGTVNTASFTSTIFDGTANLYLGNNPGYFWNGRIDAAGIWSRVLTTGERTELYNSGNGKQYPF